MLHGYTHSLAVAWGDALCPAGSMEFGVPALCAKARVLLEVAVLKLMFYSGLETNLRAKLSGVLLPCKGCWAQVLVSGCC